MMSRRARLFPKSGLFPALVLAAAFAPFGHVLALDRSAYSLEILVGGRPLREYAARGTTYVEALKGREYSVRLHNATAERIAVALSVDGLNSIDARTTPATEARKWVLGPYETITLDGWQTSSGTARRFFFTTEDRSYGSWLGRMNNLGIVAAAVFRERRPWPIVTERPRTREEAQSEPKDAAGSASPPAGAAPSAPPATQGVTPLSEPDDFAATGIGRETPHPVREVVFDAEDAPSALLEIRYEYRDALVSLGVLPEDVRRDDPLVRRERARGFPDGGFAPDPHRPRHP